MSNAVNENTPQEPAKKKKPSPLATAIKTLKTKGPIRRLADRSAIKQLSAHKVGLEQGWVWLKDGAARYSFTGEAGNSPGLEFYPDGCYTCHKTNTRGKGVIDLAIQHLAGAANNYEPTQSLFAEAETLLAGLYGLFLSVEPQRKKAKALAGAFTRDASQGDYLARQAKGVDDLLSGAQTLEAHEATAPFKEALRLLEALELDPLRVTWSPSKYTGMCILPASPYYRAASWPMASKARIAWAHGGYFGGWTKDNASAGFKDDQAGRIYFIDLDGEADLKDPLTGELVKKGRKPLVASIEMLVAGLNRAGLPVRALVYSSFDKNDDERAKAHIYFYAKDRAKTPEEHVARAKQLYGWVEEVIAQVKQPPEELEALRLDPTGANGISRLLRLAGFAKWGEGKQAAQVERVDMGAALDFKAIEERMPIEVDGGIDTSKTAPPALITYVFNDNLWKKLSYQVATGHEDAAGNPLHEEEVKWVKLGGYIRPEGITIDLANREDGAALGFWYKDATGRRFYSISLSLLTDSNGRKNAGSLMAGRGVHIQTDAGADVAGALSRWKDLNLDSAAVSVSQNGWFKNGDQVALINGPNVYGADWIPAGRNIDARKGRKGTAQEWKDNIEGVTQTKAQGLALGVSLMGPLIGGLSVYGAGSWNSSGIHFQGRSSSGKSLTLQTGLSLWGLPSPAGLLGNWKGTANSLENTAEKMSGAVMAMDELGRKGGKYNQEFVTAVKALGNGQGKGRATRSGGERRVKTWACSILSCGEVFMTTVLGSGAQGGHSVRLPDLPLVKGEGCLDKAHAEAVERTVLKAYGAAGDAWAEHVAGWSIEDWEAVHEDAKVYGKRLANQGPWAEALSGDDEAGRIADNLGLAVVALEKAALAGVFNLPKAVGTPLEVAAWALGKIVTQRGFKTCPFSRLFELIKSSASTRPLYYPTEASLKAPKAYLGTELHGVLETAQRDGAGQEVKGASNLAANGIYSGIDLVETTGRVLFFKGSVELAGLDVNAGAEWVGFTKWLAETGYGGPVAPNTNGSAKKARIAGKRERWYYIDVDALDPDDDE